MKYTKGEWTVIGGTELTVVMTQGALICEVLGVLGSVASATEANAKLIAAAPDMLEALEKWEEVYSELMNIKEMPMDALLPMYSAVLKHRKAIKKATSK